MIDAKNRKIPNFFSYLDWGSKFSMAIVKEFLHER
jgi:hypothetical protein